MTAARRQPEPRTADRLRQLAYRVRRLGITGRCTPETTLIEKEQVAAELHQLASTLEFKHGR
jgi:hypothetical protein